MSIRNQVITQQKINEIFAKELGINEEKTQEELRNILKLYFNNISAERCGNAIHLSSNREDGVLVKNGSRYKLRSTQHIGIDRVWFQITDLIRVIGNTPIDEFKPNDMLLYVAVKHELKEIASELENRYR